MWSWEETLMINSHELLQSISSTHFLKWSQICTWPLWSISLTSPISPQASATRHKTLHLSLGLDQNSDPWRSQKDQRCACVSRLVMLDSLQPLDYSPPGFSVLGILQARILEWIAISFSRGSSQPRDWTLVSGIAGRFFTIWATGKSPKRIRRALQERILSTVSKEANGERRPAPSQL